MKNLNLIPTDKPSRLHLGNSGLVLCESVLSKYTINGQHIYITNDEEIKEGDYFYSPFQGEERILKHNKFVIPFPKDRKIILATDQDLIKDGVQAIPDEFLEWFVKNPSCEWVEVEDTCLEVRVCDCAMNENCLKPGYTIIIPQEELNLNCFDCNKSLQDCTCIEDTIDMTDPLEQAAKEYAEMHLDVSGNLGKYLVKAVFQDGANYQAEQNQEAINKLISIIEWYDDESDVRPDAETFMWFEQFKKK